jgi:hypothetical protein
VLCQALKTLHQAGHGILLVPPHLVLMQLRLLVLLRRKHYRQGLLTAWVKPGHSRLHQHSSSNVQHCKRCRHSTSCCKGWSSSSSCLDSLTPGHRLMVTPTHPWTPHLPLLDASPNSSRHHRHMMPVTASAQTLACAQVVPVQQMLGCSRQRPP